MNYKEFTARFAVGFGVPLPESETLLEWVNTGQHELAVKAMEAREARGPDDPAALAKLLAVTLPDAQTDLWLEAVERSLAVSFRNKRGPASASGNVTDAGAIALFMLAFAARGPRRTAAQRALQLSAARYAGEGGFDPLSKQAWLGDALAAILTDQQAFDRATALTVNFDLGLAVIAYDKGLKSPFLTSPRPKRLKIFSETTIDLRDAQWLFDLVDAPTRALTPA